MPNDPVQPVGNQPTTAATLPVTKFTEPQSDEEIADTEYFFSPRSAVPQQSKPGFVDQVVDFVGKTADFFGKIFPPLNFIASVVSKGRRG